MKKVLLSTVALLSLVASLSAQIIQFLLKNHPLKRLIVSQVEVG